MTQRFNIPQIITYRNGPLSISDQFTEGKKNSKEDTLHFKEKMTRPGTDHQPTEGKRLQSIQNILRGYTLFFFSSMTFLNNTANVKSSHSLDVH